MKGRPLKLVFLIDRKAVARGLALALFILAARWVASDTLSLVTTYPAPSGIYNQMITVGKGDKNTVLVRDGGRLGVGTGAPSAKLHVIGDSRLEGTVRGGTFGFGGTYVFNIDGTCRYPNPFTGACACAAGFVAAQAFDFINSTCSNGYYSDGFREFNCGVVGFHCVR